MTNKNLPASSNNPEAADERQGRFGRRIGALALGTVVAGSAALGLAGTGRAEAAPAPAVEHVQEASDNPLVATLADAYDGGEAMIAKIRSSDPEAITAELGLRLDPGPLEDMSGIDTRIIAAQENGSTGNVLPVELDSNGRYRVTIDAAAVEQGPVDIDLDIQAGGHDAAGRSVNVTDPLDSDVRIAKTAEGVVTAEAVPNEPEPHDPATIQPN